MTCPFPPAPGAGATTEERRAALAALRELALKCELCPLCRTRKTVVFGEGDIDAPVMFIGEGPGRTEDETGRPFVGRSGELLTRIIEQGMQKPRSAMYIANIVKCRPTVDGLGQKDRAPDPQETAACTPFLVRQIELVRPQVIVALGSPSAKYLLGTTTGITRLRGNWGEYQGVPLMPTYHPSYVLRNGGDKSPLKKDVWSDIRQVLARLGWPEPEKKQGRISGGTC